MNAGKVTVELRDDYGISRCTPIQQQKQYLNHVNLCFNQVIELFSIISIFRLRRGWKGKVSLITPLPIFSSTRIDVLFALVYKLSSVLFK